MILATSILIFLAVLCLALGVSTIKGAAREKEVRRRLDAAFDRPDVLDSSIFRSERMSSIGLLNRILNQLQLARRLERLLVQAGMSMKVSVFLMASLTFACAAWVAVRVLMHHPVLATFAGGVAGLVPLLVVRYKRGRRLHAFTEQFPDAIDMIVSALRAGFAMSGAIQMVAEECPEPVATEFRVLFEEQKLGLDIRQALLNFADRMPSTDAAIFVTSVLIQRDTGGNLAEVLEKIAYVIRDRFRILGEVRTFTAQGRLTGLILAMLPAALALVISFLSPGYMQHLLDNELGSMLITVAIGLQVVGFLTIRKIVDVKV